MEFLYGIFVYDKKTFEQAREDITFFSSNEAKKTLVTAFLPNNILSVTSKADSGQLTLD